MNWKRKAKDGNVKIDEEYKTRGKENQENKVYNHQQSDT